MITTRKQALGIYLFSRQGMPLVALPSGERLPIEPAQVEGVLALAGEFDRDGRNGSPQETVTRVQYDGYGILGMRGEHAVVAMVSRDLLDQDLVPELERFLKRCEKRLRRQGVQ